VVVVLLLLLPLVVQVQGRDKEMRHSHPRLATTSQPTISI
jgi:hypothetical protein